MWSCDRRSAEFTLNQSFYTVLLVRKLYMDRAKDQHGFALNHYAELTEDFAG